MRKFHRKLRSTQVSVKLAFQTQGFNEKKQVFEIVAFPKQPFSQVFPQGFAYSKSVQITVWSCAQQNHQFIPSNHQKQGMIISVLKLYVRALLAAGSWPAATK